MYRGTFLGVPSNLKIPLKVPKNCTILVFYTLRCAAELFLPYKCAASSKRLRTTALEQWFSTFSGSSPGKMFMLLYLRPPPGPPPPLKIRGNIFFPLLTKFGLYLAFLNLLKINLGLRLFFGSGNPAWLGISLCLNINIFVFG